MKSRFFRPFLLLGAILMSHTFALAQGGAGTTGSRATNSNGGNASTAGAANPATGTTGTGTTGTGTTGNSSSSSSSVTNPASDTQPQLGTGANAGANAGASSGTRPQTGSRMAPSSSATGSRNPSVGAPGTIIGSTQSTGAQGLSSADGEGGAGANQGTARVNNGAGNLSTGATPTEAELGAAPSGASSAPKTGLFRGSGQSGDSNGSSARGGTAPITGSRETNSAGVGSNLGRLVPYALIFLVILVGGPLGFMFWMKRSEGDKRKPQS